MNKVWLRLAALLSGAQEPEVGVMPPELDKVIELFSACPVELQQLIVRQWAQTELPLSPGTLVKVHDFSSDFIQDAASEIGNSVAFDRQGHRIAFVDDTSLIDIRNLQTGMHERFLALFGAGDGERDVRALAFNHDGSQLATAATGERTVSLWNVLSGNREGVLGNNLPAVAGPCKFIAYNPHGTQLATAHDGSRFAADQTTGFLYVWDTQTGQVLRTLINSRAYPTALAFSPHGCHVATGDTFGNVTLFNIQTRQIMPLYTQGSDINSLAFNKNGTRITSASDHGEVCVFNLQTNTITCLLKSHSWRGPCVTLNNDGTRCVSTDYSGSLTLWDLETGKRMPSFSGLCGAAVSKKIIFGQNENLAIQDRDRIHVWTDSENLLRTYFKTSTVDESTLLLILIHYQKYLKEKYPKREAVRIQDVALFAQALKVKGNFSTEELTATAKKMPLNARRALVGHFRIYDCNDQQMDRQLALARNLTR